jgi:hypothetical protein
VLFSGVLRLSWGALDCSNFLSSAFLLLAECLEDTSFITTASILDVRIKGLLCELSQCCPRFDALSQSINAQNSDLIRP